MTQPTQGNRLIKREIPKWDTKESKLLITMINISQWFNAQVHMVQCTLTVPFHTTMMQLLVEVKFRIIYNWAQLFCLVVSYLSYSYASLFTSTYLLVTCTVSIYKIIQQTANEIKTATNWTTFNRQQQFAGRKARKVITQDGKYMPVSQFQEIPALESRKGTTDPRHYSVRRSKSFVRQL